MTGGHAARNAHRVATKAAAACALAASVVLAGGAIAPVPEATTPATGQATTPATSRTATPATGQATTGQPALRVGSRGTTVLALQKRLSALGYWLGTPDGVFGDTTRQAVYALQKAAGISRDGVVGPVTRTALARMVVPKPRPATGHVIEIDLARGLLMITTDGRLRWTLNTSTGGGYVYTGRAIAHTPVGKFSIFREVDRLDISRLGTLWRPKYFHAGYAIHGADSVPPYPASHGCVRVSNAAINWMWAKHLAPLGTSVWIY